MYSSSFHAKNSVSGEKEKNDTTPKQKLLTVLVVKGERGEERGARAGGVADRAANVVPLLKKLRAGTAVVAHKGDVAGDHDVVGFLF